MTIEIQKRTMPVFFIAILVLVLLAIGASAIWVLMVFVFPTLPGFLDIKLTAISILAVVPIWAIYLIIKQSSKTIPGLTIGEQGITDCSNAASIGFIPWSDIASVKEAVGAFKRELVVIIVKNPDTYINKTLALRESRQVSYQQFGSPIVINVNNLECTAQGLISMLSDRIERVLAG
jgi:hypothetical protein